MLLGRKPADISPDNLVFTTPSGKSIDDNNFRNRAWKILYRQPYATRSTLISHALDLGHSPIMVAQLTEHDVKTPYSNYAGYVNSKPMLLEL